MKKNILFIFVIFIIFFANIAMKDFAQEKQTGNLNQLKFSHILHAKEQGISCVDCHSKASESLRSFDNLIPVHENCQSCHEEQIENRCSYCHVNPENIIGRSILKRELIFSHKSHLDQNIKCQFCHEGMENVSKSVKENLPQMATCSNCHTEKKIKNQCETCHTNFTSLIPTDHRSINFVKEHGLISRIGDTEISCTLCHTENFCQSCHTIGSLKKIGTTGNMLTDPLPKNSVSDSPEQLKLQQVHSLNYRYTHGFDAKSKQLDCNTCHEQHTFCVTCHQAGSKITTLKIKPKNHDQPGFKTWRKGTGGGQHAELARRDLESCTACHDVEGADPTCMMCHTEDGSVR